MADDRTGWVTQEAGASAAADAVARAQNWMRERSYDHSEFPPEWLAGGPRATVSVCLPARECADTVRGVVSELVRLRDAHVVDEVVVVDSASTDGTAERAQRAGATVYQEADLLPEHGPVRGKGDAMWRALSVLSGELVCFIDADIESFSAHFVSGLLGPLLIEPQVSFVKACYRRPFELGGVTLPEGGGRVNHLVARPALALFYPELGGVRQPLAGEVAARRTLLERIPFATGYGVEIAMLLDVFSEVGLEGIAQVDLGVHENPHKGLKALSRMSYAVLSVIAERLRREGRLNAVELAGLIDAGSTELHDIRVFERPPMARVLSG
jgi:glucosyl-3-phosphoglycerate synthase